MKKENILCLRCVAVAAVLCFSSAVFAFDFGGLLTNSTGVQTYREGNFNVDQKNSASLWTRQNFDKSGKSYFAAEGVYNFEGDFEEKVFTNVLDVNLLKIAFEKNVGSSAKIGGAAGRFYFSDLSGIIFTQNIDGAQFYFQNNWLKVSLYGAYTGLLNALDISMITTPASDFMGNGTLLVESAGFETDTSKLYVLAQKYAVGDVTLTLPNLFAGQTVAAEFLGTFRLEGELFNRMYATLALSGPILQSLYYNAASTLEIEMYGGDTKFANLSLLNLNYYFKNASIGVNGLYASGNQGGLSRFSGFTKNSSTYAFMNFLYSGIVKAGVSGTFKPLENLLLSAGADAIFNAAAGDDNSQIEYYAFEYSAGVTWQVKSDFQLGVSACQFFDKDNSGDVKKTYFAVNGALTF